jgi:hypothetical protein
MDPIESTPQLYAALLVYVSSSTAAEYDPLYEETVTIIEATSEQHATARAREFGTSRETQYLNEYGETITWSLKHVVDVSKITGPIGDGAEIYTRHFHNYDAYRAFELFDPS